MKIDSNKKVKVGQTVYGVLSGYRESVSEKVVTKVVTIETVLGKEVTIEIDNNNNNMRSVFFTKNDAINNIIEGQQKQIKDIKKQIKEFKKELV